MKGRRRRVAIDEFSMVENTLTFCEYRKILFCFSRYYHQKCV